MANSRKVHRTPRYDRLLGAAGLLLCLILLIFGISRCVKRKRIRTGFR